MRELEYVIMVLPSAFFILIYFLCSSLFREMRK